MGWNPGDNALHTSYFRGTDGFLGIVTDFKPVRNNEALVVLVAAIEPQAVPWDLKRYCPSWWHVRNVVSGLEYNAAEKDLKPIPPPDQDELDPGLQAVMDRLKTMPSPVPQKA